jgi:hypothetical protein
MDKAAKDRDEKARRFLRFYVLLSQAGLTEEQIADELGFGSPGVLYK